LYLNPPDKALVLCVDQKAQIQALERGQPLLLMRRGQAERALPIMSVTAPPISSWRSMPRPGR
jgi:hypothetical protein